MPYRFGHSLYLGRYVFAHYLWSLIWDESHYHCWMYFHRMNTVQ